MSYVQMSNDEFLVKIIELSSLIDITRAKFILDMEDKIVWAGDGIAPIIGKIPKEIINKNYLMALPIPTDNVIPIASCIDKVKSEHKLQEFLSVNLNHRFDYLLLYGTVLPLINPSNDEIVAISIESRPVTFTLYFSHILSNVTGKITPSSVNYIDSVLTKREHEIAFLLFHTTNSEQIASILSLFSSKAVTAKTIRNIISQQLFIKFKVYNQPSLLQTLRELGYHKKIPPSLLTNLHIDLSTL